MNEHKENSNYRDTHFRFPLLFPPLVVVRPPFRCIDSKSRPTYAEKIFLFIGSLMFFAVGELNDGDFRWKFSNLFFCLLWSSGGLVLASIDQIPDDLIDNAIILGCLSFFVAFLFLIDMSEKMGTAGKRRSDATQTDTNSIDRHFVKSQSMTTLNSQANLMDSEANRASMRSNQQSSNPFITQQQAQSYNGNVQHDQTFSGQNFNSQPQSLPSTYVEDIVETQTLPTAQNPVFSKVKQPPTVLNHFETEPYKKILSRTNQQSTPTPYTRYHDTAQHQHDPSFYDDFNKFRQQTYYQGPKVDQGKLVIRDYTQQPQSSQQSCNCQNHSCDENEGQEQENATIKSKGYVSQVAKLWDSRMKSNQDSVRSHQKDIRGLNTVV
jgi:hypothetical protein